MVTKAKDTLGRRSRFKRSPSGKQLRLTERDREIMQWLYRYRYLRQDHLLRILKPVSEKRFIERLGDLFHETGFVNRPTLQAPLFDARATPMLYELSDKGADYLNILGALPYRAVTFSRRRRDAFSPQFLHTMMIIEAVLDIELEARQSPYQRFVPVDEILARAPEPTREAANPLAIPVRLHENDTYLIPDALYGIEHDEDGEKGYRFWAIECERTSPENRSNQRLSSTGKKKELYTRMLRDQTYREYWGIPNLKVQFVNHQGTSDHFSG